MNCKERVFAALNCIGVDRVPVAGITQTGIVELMDLCETPWPDAHKDPEKMAKLAWAAHEIAGLESARVPFDIYYLQETMGCKLYKWEKVTQPMVMKPAIKNPEDIDKLTVPDPHKDGRLPVIIKAIEILKPKCDEAKVPLIVHLLSSFASCLALGLPDIIPIMRVIKDQPELFEKALKISEEATTELGKAFIEAGAEIIFWNEGTASLISTEDYKRMGLSPENLNPISKFKEMGAYVIMHSCGDPRHNLSLMAKTGVHGISIGQDLKISEARELVGEKVALCGNVDPTYTLIRKKPEEVIEEAKRCIEEGTDLLCPGCGFGPKTPLANMKALVEAGKKYGYLGRLARRGR